MRRGDRTEIDRLLQGTEQNKIRGLLEKEVQKINRRIRKINKRK